MFYHFKASDKGKVGDPCEMSWKRALGISNPDTVSPKNKPDFYFDGHYYDVKQNGSVIKYDMSRGYVLGSSRVIYATHAVHTRVNHADGTCDIEIDLLATQWYVVDKRAFCKYLVENGYAKYNKTRDELNIQTLYNYTKDAYHGSKGKRLEEWLYENDLADDTVIERMLEALS